MVVSISLLIFHKLAESNCLQNCLSILSFCMQNIWHILYSVIPTLLLFQVFAWGDNDHGQQGDGTTTVNKKPALVQGLEGVRITRVACGSSHSIAWATTDTAIPSMHEPVLFTTPRDPLGATELGKYK